MQRHTNNADRGIEIAINTDIHIDTDIERQEAGQGASEKV